MTWSPPARPLNWIPPILCHQDALRRIRRFTRKHERALWAAIFLAFAAVLYVWAAVLTHGFATRGLRPDGYSGWEPILGDAGAIALAILAAQYFFRIALKELPPRLNPRSCLAATLPSALAWAVPTVVTVAVIAATMFVERPELAVAYIASLLGVMAATVLTIQTARGGIAGAKDTGAKRLPPAPANPTRAGPDRQGASPAQTVRPPSASAGALSHAKPPVPAAGLDQEWLDCLRSARVKVNSVKALYAAGYRSLDDLRKAEDRGLLKIKGIGPATVRRIRACLQQDHSAGPR